MYPLESYWRQTLVSLPREICHYLHQPSTWGNQRGELTTLQSSKFLAPLPGTQGATSRRVPTIANLRSRCRTPVYKIGELRTIFYLCILVLLVYLSVFTFVSLTKNTKNTCCYHGLMKTLSCVTSLVTTTVTLSALLLLHLPLQHLLMRLNLLCLTLS